MSIIKSKSNSIQDLVDSLLWNIYGKVSLQNNENINPNHKNIQTFSCNRKLNKDNKCSWKYSKEMLKSQTMETLIEISASLRMEIRIIGIYLTKGLKTRDKMLRKKEFLCEILTYHLKLISEQSGDNREMKFGLIPPNSSSNDSSATAIMGISNTSSDFNQWLHAMKMVARLPGGMPPEFRRKLWLALAEKHLQTNGIDWNKEEKKCLCDQWRDDDEELGIQIVKDLHRTGSSLFSGPAGSLNQAKLKRVLLGYARWNPEVGYCQGFNMLGALILQVMDKCEIESLKVMIFLVEGILPAGYFCGSLGGLQADMAVFRDILSTRLPKLAKHLERLQGPMGEGSFEPPLTNVFTMQWFLTLFCTCLPINCVLRVWDLVLIEGSDVLLRTALAIWGLLEGRILAIKTADEFYCKMGTLSGELLNGHLFDSNGLIQKIVDLGPITDLQKMRDKHLYNIAPWRDKRGLRLFYSDDDGESDDDSRIAVTTAWGFRLGRRSSAGLPPAIVTNKVQPDSKDKIALDISLLKQQYSRLRERQKQAHIILTNSARQTINPSSSVTTIPVNQLLLGRNAIVSNKGRRIGPPQGAIPPARKPNIIKMSKQTKRNSGETLHWKDTESVVRRKITGKWKDVESERKLNMESNCEDGEYSLNRSPSATSSLSSVSGSSVAGSTKSMRKTESSSYSEDDSDGNSSTSTSLCDDENLDYTASSIEASPLKKLLFTDPVRDQEIIASSNIEDCILTFEKFNTLNINNDDDDVDNDDNKATGIDKNNLDSKLNINFVEKSSSELYKFVKSEDKDTFSNNETLNNYSINTNKKEIEDILIKIDSIAHSGIDDSDDSENLKVKEFSYEIFTNNNDSPNEGIFKNRNEKNSFDKLKISRTETENVNDEYSHEKILTLKESPKIKTTTTLLSHELLSSAAITSTSQLSPIADFSQYLNSSSISPLKTPSSYLKYSTVDIDISSNNIDKESATKFEFSVNEEGVTNEYFERINVAERPNRLELKDSFMDSHKLPPHQFDGIDAKCVADIKEIPVNDLFPMKSRETSPILYYNESKNIDESACTENLLSENQFEMIGSDRVNFLKEKSFSLDEPAKNKENFRPTSCPETRSGSNNTDRILKIIEENSMILHRILKKNIDEDSTTDDEVRDDKNDKLNTDDDGIYDKTTILNLTNSYDPINTNPITSETYTSEISNVDSNLSNDDNISATLSSIKNTIKSIDFLCQDDRKSRLDKTMNYINKTYDDRDEREYEEFTKKPVTTTTTIQPLVYIENAINVTTKLSSVQDQISDDNGSLNKTTFLSRLSRDKRRDISPRRRCDEDKEEYESRFRRNQSPNFFSIEDDDCNNAYELPQKSKDFNTLDSSANLINIENYNTNKLNENNTNVVEYIEKTAPIIEYNLETNLVTDSKCNFPDKELKSSYHDDGDDDDEDDEYSAVKKVVYPSEKLEIRHTTVTSTFYDRFMSQKKERNTNMDKSPSSPIITRSYLESLKPPITYDRNTKSAENSPSRSKFDTGIIIEPMSPPPNFYEANTNYGNFTNDSSEKCCDNIPANLKITNYDNILPYSPLPRKTIKRPELGIKLGLYKCSTGTSESSLTYNK